MLIICTYFCAQDVFNLLPNLNVHELVKAFAGELVVFVFVNFFIVLS